MKMYEIKQLTNEELLNSIKDEQASLVDLRFLLALKQLDKTAKIKNTKKTIARFKTVMKQRSIQPVQTESKQEKEGAE